MTDQANLNRDRPATFEIKVRGCISERWANWFDGMSITVEERNDAGQPGTDLPITTLTGAVTDQAALMGLLQKLYTLGAPVLLVRQKDAEWTNDMGMQNA